MSKIHTYQQLFFQPMEYSQETLEQLLLQLLSPKRYEHVMRVLHIAHKFVEECDYCAKDKYRITQAVLFHDLAKGMSDIELQEYAYVHQISLKGVPSPVYHAIVGAWMAKKYFGIEDQDILDAVYYHTTGSIKFMNNKIGAMLFLADYLEPGRDFDRSDICELIPNNILLGLKEVVKEKIISVIQRDRVLDQESISFYHALIQ